MSTAPKPQKKSISTTMSTKADKKKSATDPNPPPKPRSLLTTDDGQEVNAADDKNDDLFDLTQSEEPEFKRKQRISLSIRLFGKKKNTKKPSQYQRGSFMGFFGGNKKKLAGLSQISEQDAGDRVESIVWRRKASREMTKSMKLDADIYTYLKERSNSIDEEEKTDGEEQRQSVLPPIAPARTNGRTNLLVGLDQAQDAMDAGNARQTTTMSTVKRAGFFRRVRSRVFGRRKPKIPGQKKRGVMSRMFSRMSWGSYNQTNADDLQQLLHSKEADALQEQEDAEKNLMRKDSDETDLSDDSGIDSSLLVKDRPTAKLPAEVEGVDDKLRSSSRLSKIFEPDDDEPQMGVAEEKPKKNSFLGTEMTKTTDVLPKVSAVGDRTSNEKIEAEKQNTKLDAAFSLAPSSNKATEKAENKL